MNTEKIIKEARIIVITCSVIGVLLIVLFAFLSISDIFIISNKKALVGLSLTPFSMALIYYLKISTIKRSPEKVKNIIITENDERISTLKNEAAAISFKIIQGAIFLSYMGYTLLVPEDIFESVGWWILLALFLLAFISHGVISMKLMANNAKENED